LPDGVPPGSFLLVAINAQIAGVGRHSVDARDNRAANSLLIEGCFVVKVGNLKG
jgi:hypothetical protein